MDINTSLGKIFTAIIFCNVFYVANARNLWFPCARLGKLCVPSHTFGHITQPIAQKYLDF